ncbi:MAG TPA: head-tail connector protein [Gemmatimonadales bacterium]|nr:head-tail connector protein [Gemmatimonadales bacterium]
MLHFPRRTLVTGPTTEPVTLAEVRRHLLVDPPASIVSSSVANPTVITTTAAHGYATGDRVTISGHTGSTPGLNATHIITVTGATTFTVPVNVTVGGTGGVALRAHPHDDLLTGWITAARGVVERMTDRQLLPARWRVKFDRFPRWREPIELPLPPLQSVVSVTYIDPGGATVTWSSLEYVVDAPSGPQATAGRLYPALGLDYPTTGAIEDAVTVEFDAGYASAAAVPQELKQAMYLLIGAWYEHREAVLPDGASLPEFLAVETLLLPFRRLVALVR